MRSSWRSWRRRDFMKVKYWGNNTGFCPQCERSVSSEEEEEPPKSTAKGQSCHVMRWHRVMWGDVMCSGFVWTGSSEEVRSGTSGENDEAQRQQNDSSGEIVEPGFKSSNTVSWVISTCLIHTANLTHGVWKRLQSLSVRLQEEEQAEVCFRGRSNFVYRRLVLAF